MSASVLTASGRRLADFLLFGVTSAELIILFFLTPTFTLTDWIYVSQHLIVLGIALTRPAPKLQDHSLLSSAAVTLSYGYSYGQVIYLNWMPGNEAWPAWGLVLVTAAACLSFVSLLTIGRLFGIRPALRGLVTHGPYGIVRHPMYLAYMVGDIGYNLQEWNYGTVVLMLAGWTSLIYRIYAEERIISHDAGWSNYIATVRYRILPWVW
jgi:protein-S-isoprenylcysteine O-methyltransferase Ste14